MASIGALCLTTRSSISQQLELMIRQTTGAVTGSAGALALLIGFRPRHQRFRGHQLAGIFDASTFSGRNTSWSSIVRPHLVRRSWRSHRLFPDLQAMADR